MKLIVVGSIKEKALLTCIDTYVKRIKSFIPFKIVEVKDEAAPLKNSEKENMIVKNMEGERIFRHLKEQDFCVLVDLHGDSLDSCQLANHLDSWQIHHKNIVFVIGGSLGLSQALIARSQYRLCLSKLTFPHQLTRLIVCEQIYRAFSIIHHLPYHK